MEEPYGAYGSVLKDEGCCCSTALVLILLAHCGISGRPFGQVSRWGRLGARMIPWLSRVTIHCR